MSTPSDPLPRLLIVEDDENLRVTLADVMEDEGFDVVAVQTGQAALDSVAVRAPDAVVLDIMLPDIDGYTICRRIRAAGCAGGVLMLTARTLEDDVVKGFEVGADDYLAKPYRLRELIVRVRALLRRRGAANDQRGTIPGFQIDRQGRTVGRHGGPSIELTRTEFDLLLFFVDHEGKALSRDVILQRVWGEDVVVDPRTVDNFVSSLKRKLDWTSGSGFAFRSVRGVGYRYERDTE
jgi:DNA-binding response OmpR family regulator